MANQDFTSCIICTDMKPESIQIAKSALNPPFCPHKENIFLIAVRNKCDSLQQIRIQEIFYPTAENKNRPALSGNIATVFSDGISLKVKAGLKNHILLLDKIRISPGSRTLIFYTLES